MTFDHLAQRVSILKDGAAEILDIPPLTHDPLSCLYFLRRSSQLDPGMSIFFSIHHDKKNYDVEVKVEAIETISGPWGEREVTRLLILMPFRGIFLNEGNIRVWVTNDQERVPLKMQARMVIGSIEAMLESPPSQ